MNNKGSIIPAVLFCILLVAVLATIVFTLGQKAINEGVIDLQGNVKPEEKQSALEFATKMAEQSVLRRSEAWGRLEFPNGEWDQEDTTLEIRYMYPLTGNSVVFFVIVHPKEQIGGVFIPSNHKSSTLALGSYGDRLPVGSFVKGQKILSTFGIIHSLVEEVNDSVSVDPPISKKEAESSFLFVDDKKATVEGFTIFPKNK